MVARTDDKLAALSPLQRRFLRQLLIVEKATYEKARARMLELFSVSLSTGTISKFWYRDCLHLKSPKQNPRLPVLLDVILRSARPIRVTVLKNNTRLFFKVGRMARRGLDKKPVHVIGPDATDNSKP